MDNWRWVKIVLLLYANPWLRSWIVLLSYVLPWTLVFLSAMFSCNKEIPWTLSVCHARECQNFLYRVIQNIIRSYNVSINKGSVASRVYRGFSEALKLRNPAAVLKDSYGKAPMCSSTSICICRLLRSIHLFLPLLLAHLNGEMMGFSSLPSSQSSLYKKISC